MIKMIIILKALTKAEGKNCKNVVHLHKTHANYCYNHMESLSFIPNTFLQKLMLACNLKMWYNKVGAELNTWQWIAYEKFETFLLSYPEKLHLSQ